MARTVSECKLMKRLILLFLLLPAIAHGTIIFNGIEADPQVDAVTSGKVCEGTGTQVTCDLTWADKADVASPTFTGTVTGDIGTFTGALSGATLTGKISGVPTVSTPTIPDLVGRLYTTTGASSTITFNLQTVTLGDRASFCVTAQQVLINPNGSERILEVTDANGDSITLANIEGCCVTIIGISSGKMVALLWGVETSCTITDSN